MSHMETPGKRKNVSLIGAADRKAIGARETHKELYIVPHLSRSYKAQKFYSPLSIQEKKRPRGCSSSQTSEKPTRAAREEPACFEVRQCAYPKVGVGMFATRPIGCGEIIISNEEPIVSALSTTAFFRDHTDQDKEHSSFSDHKICHLFCAHCSAPLWHLRRHIEASLIWESQATQEQIRDSSSNTIELPIMGMSEVGPIFSGMDKNSTGILGSNGMETARWCSTECRTKACQYNFQPANDTLLDSQLQPVPSFQLEAKEKKTGVDAKLEEFLDRVDNPNISRLAAQGLALCLVSLRSSNTTERYASHSIAEALQRHLWWRDYGSHPLWWHLPCGDGGDRNGVRNSRRSLALEFILVLMDSWQRETSFSSGDIEGLLTETNIGELLGMLQCNVMEFEYPSPVQQYLEQIEDLVLQEAEHEEESVLEHEEQEYDGQRVIVEKRMPEWLEAALDGRGIEGGRGGDSDRAQRNFRSPVVGFALYPLLTLANHDCDPNASIDFLGESNRGSMVALRGIATGEEICITYVPNGGWDGGGNPVERFEAFRPTRTWEWLRGAIDGDDSDVEEGSEEDDRSANSSICSGARGGGEERGESDDAEKNKVSEPDDASVSKSSDPSSDHCSNRDGDRVEGSEWIVRARALQEYGFDCRCKRCKKEEQQDCFPSSNGTARSPDRN